MRAIKHIVKALEDVRTGLSAMELYLLLQGNVPVHFRAAMKDPGAHLHHSLIVAGAIVMHFDTRRAGLMCPKRARVVIESRP